MRQRLLVTRGECFATVAHIFNSRSRPSPAAKIQPAWFARQGLGSGVKWGAPAHGVGFDESLLRCEEFLSIIAMVSPENLRGRCAKANRDLNPSDAVIINSWNENKTLCFAFSTPSLLAV
jgi:hypothetical protein